MQKRDERLWRNTPFLEGISWPFLDSLWKRHLASAGAASAFCNAFQSYSARAVSSLAAPNSPLSVFPPASRGTITERTGPVGRAMQPESQLRLGLRRFVSRQAAACVDLSPHSQSAP
jgi:hypothetical protein